MRFKRRLLTLAAVFLILGSSSCTGRTQVIPEPQETPEPTAAIERISSRPSETVSTGPEEEKTTATPEAVCTPSELPDPKAAQEEETEPGTEEWEAPEQTEEPEPCEEQEYTEPAEAPEITPEPTAEPTPESTPEPIPQSEAYDIYEAMDAGNAEAATLGYTVDLSLTPENAGYSPPDMISGETLGYVGGQGWLNQSARDGAVYEAECASGMGYSIKGTRGRSLITYDSDTDQYMIYFLYG